MLRKIEFDLADESIWDKKIKRRYNFFNGFFFQIMTLRSYVWRRLFRKGLGLSKVYLVNKNKWYIQKKNHLVKNLIIKNKNNILNNAIYLNYNNKLLLQTKV